MPKAARITDMHTCPAVNPGPVPHVGGPIISGSPNVNTGYIPAARVDDTAVCVPAIDSISKGSSNVFINHRQAARIGDPTKHGGVIVAGCATVNIGTTPQSFALTLAARNGAPFCEECERAKRQQKELVAPAPSFETPEDSAEAPASEPPATTSTSELAKQPDPLTADGREQQRRDAREKVALDFLTTHPRQLSSAAIESQLRNIDLGSPVEVIQRPGADGTPQSMLKSRSAAPAGDPLAGAIQFMGR